MADYQARKQEHVNLVKHEIVTVLDDSSKWWLVRKSNGDEGKAPSNYLELISSLAEFDWFHADIRDRSLAEQRLNV